MQLQWMETEAFENQIILIHEWIISQIQQNEVIHCEWIILLIRIFSVNHYPVHTGQNDSFIIDLVLKSSSLTLNDYISTCSSNKSDFRGQKQHGALYGLLLWWFVLKLESTMKAQSSLMKFNKKARVLDYRISTFVFCQQKKTILVWNNMKLSE